MHESLVLTFLAGFATLGYLTLGLFFLKFWRRTRDSFFAIFAFAFWLLAANEIAYPSTDAAREYGWIYVMRLAAFVLIIIATIRKNMRITPRD
jgi:predicted permease